jgi:HD-GYP domain-containing protein (c-di-GMP phosphodiesterase class II)
LTTLPQLDILTPSDQQHQDDLITRMKRGDTLTYLHCRRVARYAEAMAGFARLPRHQIHSIRAAAGLHDIGKLFLPRFLLLKKESLTHEEYRRMQDHSWLGQNALARNSRLAELAIFVRHHHERWDGKGYPDGLAGLDIPFNSRLIHVADSLDVMLQARTYKRAYPLWHVLAELIHCKGTQFDPDLVDLTVDWIRHGGLEKPAEQPIRRARAA